MPENFNYYGKDSLLHPLRKKLFPVKIHPECMIWNLDFRIVLLIFSAFEQEMDEFIEHAQQKPYYKIS
jgi:hypothetical protein